MTTDRSMPTPHPDGDWDYITYGADVELPHNDRSGYDPDMPAPYVPLIDRRTGLDLNETAPCGGPCGQFVLPAELCECNDGLDRYCPVCCRLHHQDGWPFNDKDAA